MGNVKVLLPILEWEQSLDKLTEGEVTLGMTKWEVTLHS